MTPFAKSLRSSVAVVALLAGMAMVASPAAQGQTLEEALSLAYETNPELLAERANLRRTDESATQARGGWRPNISASGSFGITDVNADNNGVRTTDDHSFPITGALTASQPIYTFGRVQADVDEADANIEATRAGLFQTEQEVLLDAVVAYVNVIRDTSILNLQINNVQRLDKQLEATNDRFRVGEVTRTDVAQSDARRARSQADRTLAEGNLIISRVAFERVVGVVPATLTEPPIPAGLPESREEAVSIATQESYPLIQAKFQELAARHLISQAEADLLPQLNLVGQAEQTYNTNGGDNEVTTLSAELQLSVPIYQRGVVHSQVRQAKENANRVRLLVDNQRRAVVEAAASAYEDYKTALAQIESLRSEANSAEIALDGVQQEATVGARTVLDVLDAEQELLDAQVSLVTADRNAIVAAFSLLAAMGRLTAQDLALPVEIYDYDRHYLAVESKWIGTEPPGTMPGN